MRSCDVLKKDFHSSVSLSGSQWGEIILVRLREGGPIFGVGAFKVKEALPWRRIFESASSLVEAATAIEVRGDRVSLFDLGRMQGASGAELKKGVALLADIDGHLQAFGVHSINGVGRVDWSSAQESSKGGELFAMEARTEGGEPIVVLGLERRSKAIGQSCATPPSQKAATVVSLGTSPATQRAVDEGAQALGLGVKNAGAFFKGWDALEEALSQLGCAKIAAIVVEAEAQDGGIDGYSLARRIKADERFKEIPLILAASASAPPSQALGRQIGVDGFLNHASASAARSAIESASGDDKQKQEKYGS